MSASQDTESPVIAAQSAATIGVVASLKALRLKRGLTQAQLGALSGMHEHQVQRVEKGRQPASARTLERLATALEARLQLVPTLWTRAQCDKLNEWQACDWVHPFTCGNRGNRAHKAFAEAAGASDTGILIATPDGWRCAACDYTQDWAHGFMFYGAPPHPFAANVRSEATITDGDAVPGAPATGGMIP
jgi:transcriptional regulator with XRE-family HTH domain